MLKVIALWWLIGILISLAILRKNIDADIEKYGFNNTFVGFILLGFIAPIYFMYGLIVGIIKIFDDEES